MNWTALPQLSQTEQVALLFLLLFGALSMASIAAMMRGLRTPTGAGLAQQERAQRIRADLRALWVGASIFWLAWVSGAGGATVLFGIVSFLALREFITLAPTRRSDHRSLILAFFIVLPLQYVIVATRHFDLFTVFIPVYVFLAIPVVSALAGDPERFLERNAKIQWGITVCVYGLSHAPALLLLDVPTHEGRGAFLVFFLVMVTSAAQLAQEAWARWLRRRPVARHIDRLFSYRAWLGGALAGGLMGAALFWITPFDPLRAAAMGVLAGASGSLGEFVMKALKRDAGVHNWGNHPSVTGAVGLLDRVAPLCFAAPVFFHSTRWYFGFGTG